MKLIKQTLFSMSYWCFILSLTLMWNPQTIQAEASIDYDESMESGGRITCFQLNKQDGSALISLQNGMTFCESEFPNDIRIRTCESGSHESLSFRITGPSGTWTNTENHLPYDSKQFWPAPGTWTIRAELFEGANLSGSRCDSETISFTVMDCSGSTPTCSVNVTTSNLICNDNGTSTPNDDTFTVDVTVNGSNTSNRWIGGLGGQDREGQYGNTVTFGPFNVNSGSTISGWFRDRNDSNCQMDITVTPPNGCSQNTGTPTGCASRISTSGRTITVSNLQGSIRSVQFFSSSFATLKACDSWGSGECGNSESFTVPSCGTYFVQVQTYEGWSNQLCNIFETIEINSGCDGGGGGTPTFDCPSLNANIGDACDDGNRNTSNDRVQSNCTCAGTPNAPTFDCPNLNANIGDACDDGNRNTSNDRVQSNCTCEGVSSGSNSCNASIRVSGNEIIVSGLDNAVEQVQITNASWVTIASCDSWDGNTPACGSTFRATVSNGTFNVFVKTYTSAWSPICDIFETVTVGGGGGTPALDCPNLNANIGDACDDGNRNTSNDRVQSNCTCAGTPNTPTLDCPNLNANIGDACNDGNGNTNNDVVQSNCTCAGTPAGGNGGSCNIGITVGSDFIRVTGAVGPYPYVGIFNDFGVSVFECHAFNGGCPTTITVDNLTPGVYWVNANVVDNDFVTILCDAFEDVTVGGQGRATNGTNYDLAQKQSISVEKVVHDFTLFPNPANEVVNVSLVGYEGKDVTIQMVDYVGKAVKSVEIDNVSDSKVAIPISRFSNGIYTVRILSAGIKPVGKKMIVNKRF